MKLQNVIKNLTRAGYQHDVLHSTLQYAIMILEGENTTVEYKVNHKNCKVHGCEVTVYAKKAIISEEMLSVKELQFRFACIREARR